MPESTGPNLGPHSRRLPSGVLTSLLACTQTIDRIVKEAAGGSIPPPTRSAGATHPQQGETPAACSHPTFRSSSRFVEPRKTFLRVQETAGSLTRPLHLASASSPATRAILPAFSRRSIT